MKNKSDQEDMHQCKLPSREINYHVQHKQNGIHLNVLEEVSLNFLHFSLQL